MDTLIWLTGFGDVGFMGIKVLSGFRAAEGFRVSHCMCHSRGT